MWRTPTTRRLGPRPARERSSNTTPDKSLPAFTKHWSLPTMRRKLIKIRAKIVHLSGCMTAQMTEVAVPRELLSAILDCMKRFRVPWRSVRHG